MPKISLITLNWNGYKDTSELLNSLKNVKSPKFKVLVVDNNSTGDDVQKLKQNYNGFIDVIKCDTNLGFAGGNNVGIKKALNDNADYILLINNDTIVEPEFLKVLVDKMDSNRNIGIIAPQINYYDYPYKIWSAGGKINKIRASGFARYYKNNNIIKNSDKIVEFVSGCCMLIRKEVIRDVGLFDENYFLYIEDTDFCYRTVKSGYNIIVTGYTKIYHKVSSSSELFSSSAPIYYATRNRLFFTRKNFPETFILSFVYLFTTMFLKNILWILIRKLDNCKAVYKAFRDFMTRRMGRREYLYN
jgi:GT2 family glycosyltransferase